MGDMEHLGRAEDEGEAHRGEGVDRPQLQAVEKELEKEQIAPAKEAEKKTPRKK